MEARKGDGRGGDDGGADPGAGEPLRICVAASSKTKQTQLAKLHLDNPL